MMSPNSLEDVELSALPERASAKMKHAAAHYQSMHLTERYTDIIIIIERFNMWANSVGAFHGIKDSMSLAHRIREAPKLKMLFCDILNDLIEDVDKRKPNSPMYGSKAHLYRSASSSRLE
jgi:hypothetical protein